MSTQTTLAKRLPLLIALGVTFFAVLLGFLIKNYILEDQPLPKKVVQQVTLIIPPPPPPPPPQEQEPEPETEIEEEVVEEQIDEAMPEDSLEDLAGEDLGIDGDGAAGSDGFGLVARKGGRGLLGGGSAYSAVVQAEITDVIAADEALRYQGYQAVLKLWVGQSGSIERFQFSDFDGDEDTKKRLRILLASLEPFESSPPIEMPQPIRLRIQSEL